MTDLPPGYVHDAPRIVCAAPGCKTELLASAARAHQLAGTGWRCADHDGRPRPGRGPRFVRGIWRWPGDPDAVRRHLDDEWQRDQ